MCVSEISVPREFKDAILLAITSTKRCIGIKIFNDPYVSDQNGNLDGDFEEYIDRCIHDAVDLKESIEMGSHNIENDPKIVKNPNADQYVDMEKLLELRSKSKILISISFAAIFHL